MKRLMRAVLKLLGGVLVAVAVFIVSGALSGFSSNAHSMRDTGLSCDAVIGNQAREIETSPVESFGTTICAALGGHARVVRDGEVQGNEESHAATGQSGSHSTREIGIDQCQI